MSATNRGAVRSNQDYYYTPLKTIKEFWEEFCRIENKSIYDFYSILDPCAGGDTYRPCAYPEAINSFDTNNWPHVRALRFTTIDIREDSQAEYKENYLESDLTQYDMVISNPPFSLFTKFVEKAHVDVRDDGYVIFLLRIGVAASKSRREFWKQYKPKAIYVHVNRPCFMKGGSDASEYAHYVWQKGYEGDTKFYWV